MRQTSDEFNALREETLTMTVRDGWTAYGAGAVEVVMAMDADGETSSEMLRDLVRGEGDTRYALETLPNVIANLVRNRNVNQALLGKALSDVA